MTHKRKKCSHWKCFGTNHPWDSPVSGLLGPLLLKNHRFWGWFVPKHFQWLNFFSFMGHSFGGQLFELFARETNLKKQSSVIYSSDFCPLLSITILRRISNVFSFCEKFWVKFQPQIYSTKYFSGLRKESQISSYPLDPIPQIGSPQFCLWTP